MRGIKTKGQDSFETPFFLFNQLNNRFNFTIDAAATINNKKCNNYFTDGLNTSWVNHRVFCNPPFSTKSAWIKKAHDEILYGLCYMVVMILPTNSMDSTPWHEYVYGKFHYEILKNRVSFINPITGKPQSGNNSGTVMVYFWGYLNKNMA